ncbi:MAG: phage tail tube protein [Alicyclobacillus macrosporangiidus]|uniref:phage tail tube protein n=1 Tax=Alicyclobacillus macrosporangiidus TaxID=392015 RepID=UPI0026F25855|nr:phage tail tube protein [Alicyclobacillus macrosporangiidus]MCL6597941.1 phage tail tube protein [Alicyclobacillus macrosporangiidus]
MPTSLDTRKVIPGFRGKLYDDQGNFLAQVPRWQLQIAVTNTNYQPAGQAQEVGIMQSYHVTLTFTETHVTDDLIAALINALKNNQQPSFGFQGVIERPDGSTGRYVCRSCVPQGNIDVANVQPGQLLERAWNFDVNEPVDLQSLLTA